MRELRIVLTPFCNYKCFFCHGESSEKRIALQLTPSDYEFLGQATKEKLGWNTATITGGEPLISPIFGDVCGRLHQLGLDLTVVTNASLLARPAETLKDVGQINVSLHTMNPCTYEQITQTGYPLERVLDTIATTRALLPDLRIHLNYTVIKGMNDTDADFEEFLAFAKEVGAVAKFIDLSTIDDSLRTSADGILCQLYRLGFTIKDESAWQTRVTRGNQLVAVTRCPFNGRYDNLPARDIFVDPNGVLYKSYGGLLQIDALNDIKSRNAERLVKKINFLVG